MHFSLSDEHKLMRQMVREFAEKELSPGIRERDEEEHFDRALMFDRLAELGLTGIIFPERYGGAEADYLNYAIAVEELSRFAHPPASPFRRISPWRPTRSMSSERNNRKSST